MDQRSEIVEILAEATRGSIRGIRVGDPVAKLRAVHGEPDAWAGNHELLRYDPVEYILDPEDVIQIIYVEMPYGVALSIDDILPDVAPTEPMTGSELWNVNVGSAVVLVDPVTRLVRSFSLSETREWPPPANDVGGADPDRAAALEARRDEIKALLVEATHGSVLGVRLGDHADVVRSRIPQPEARHEEGGDYLVAGPAEFALDADGTISWIEVMVPDDVDVRIDMLPDVPTVPTEGAEVQPVMVGAAEVWVHRRTRRVRAFELWTK